MKSRFGVINEIFGGYSEGQVFSLYGMPSAGKSLFVLHEAEYFMKNGYRVIYIDTEGGAKDMIDVWSDRLDLKNMIVVSKRDIRSLFYYMGEDVDFTSSKNGKISMVWKGIVKKSDENTIWHDIGRVKKYVIIMDSMTAPITNFIPSTNENYPVRSDIIGHLFAMIYYVMDNKSGGFTIAIQHGSLNPTNPYSNIAIMKGGSRVVFMSKKIAYLEKLRKGVWQNIRKIHAVRTPLGKEWEKYGFLEYGDDGIKDVDEDYVMNMLNKK